MMKLALFDLDHTLIPIDSDHAWGEFATRMSGSSDLFAHNSPSTRSVNFIAAHDGMTLRDITAFEHKHNHANGENNRDGHNENYSWNHGVEGEADETIEQLRRTDVAALLATLLLSRGTPMLMAGDEFGRTQQGNNNPYCQDNDISWLQWDWLAQGESGAQTRRMLYWFVGQQLQVIDRVTSPVQLIDLCAVAAIQLERQPYRNTGTHQQPCDQPCQQITYSRQLHPVTSSETFLPV